MAEQSIAEKSIEVIANITIREFAEKLDLPASDIQKVLMQMGVLAGLNQRLAPDAITRIATKLGKSVTVIKPSTEKPPVAPPSIIPATEATPVVAIEVMDENYFSLFGPDVMVGGSTAADLVQAIAAYTRATKIDPIVALAD